MSTNSSTYLSQLHEMLNEYFNMAEIQDICFQLNIDFESVAGAEKPSRIRELLLALGRNNRLPELIDLAKELRSHVEWPPIPTDFELPASLASGNGPASPVNHNHYGDTINVGNINNAQGIAIGRGASAHVHIEQGLQREEFDKLFTPLIAEVAKLNPTGVSKVQELKAETARGEKADDEKMADLIREIADIAPAVVESLVNIFTNSIVAKAAGGATNYVLKLIRR